LEFDKPLLDDGAPTTTQHKKTVLGQLQEHNDTLLVIMALDGNNTAGRSRNGDLTPKKGHGSLGAQLLDELSSDFQGQTLELFKSVHFIDVG